MNKNIKILNKEDIESNQYSIYNILLPLPGYIKYK